MMDQAALGVFIAETFLVFVPFTTSGAIAFILVTMLLVMFRGLMPKDK
jgi:hypothetical protein